MSHCRPDRGSPSLPGAGASAVTLSAASSFSWTPKPVVAETASTPDVFWTLVAKAVLSDRAMTTPISL
jgi:hypothetical protein